MVSYSINTTGAMMKVGARAKRRITRFRVDNQGGLPGGGGSTWVESCLWEDAAISGRCSLVKPTNPLQVTQGRAHHSSQTNHLSLCWDLHLPWERTLNQRRKLWSQILVLMLDQALHCFVMLETSGLFYLWTIFSTNELELCSFFT